MGVEPVRELRIGMVGCGTTSQARAAAAKAVELTSTPSRLSTRPPTRTSTGSSRIAGTV